MSSAEYYIMKCPYCDADITKVLEVPSSIVLCPNCNKVLHLYSVFGYNMWLSENGKMNKVSKKPIKDVKQDEETNDNVYDGFRYEEYEEYEEYDEDAVAEGCLADGILSKKRPRVIHEMLSFNADVCLIQYQYLMKVGFSREEALKLVEKLIEQDFIL